MVEAIIARAACIAVTCSRICASILVDTIAARRTESSSGARNIENILSRTLLPELSADVLARLAEGDAISQLSVGIGPSGFRYTIN
jgi:type VI secretion system protein VasG